MSTKCIVCGGEICPEELGSLAKEFKNAPSHDECFDSFDNAYAFIYWAIKKGYDIPHTVEVLGVPIGEDEEEFRAKIKRMSKEEILEHLKLGFEYLI